MGFTDYLHDFDPRTSLDFATYTGDADGASVDLKDAEGNLILIQTGAVVDGTHAIEIQESDDDATWNAVADADLLNSEPSLDQYNDNEVHKLAYTGGKRYIRVTTNVSGVSSGGDYGGFVLARPRNLPA